MFSAYVTNLGLYNEGHLVGDWLSLPCDPEEIRETLHKIGCDQLGYEEYFIADYEEDGCLFSPSEYFGEYERLEDLNDIATSLADLEDDQLQHLTAYLETSSWDIKEALEQYEDTIFYPDMSLLDVAYMIVDDCYDLPEIAQRYFDYEAFARDLSFGNYVETSYGTICL